MKHAVLCWEYGAGLGHISKLKILAERLKAEGWRTTLVNPSHVKNQPDPVFDTILAMPYARQLNQFDFKQQVLIGSHKRVVKSFGYESDKFVLAG